MAKKKVSIFALVIAAALAAVVILFIRSIDSRFKTFSSIQKNNALHERSLIEFDESLQNARFALGDLLFNVPVAYLWSRKHAHAYLDHEHQNFTGRLSSNGVIEPFPEEQERRTVGDVIWWQIGTANPVTFDDGRSSRRAVLEIQDYAEDMRSDIRGLIMTGKGDEGNFLGFIPFENRTYDMEISCFRTWYGAPVACDARIRFSPLIAIWIMFDKEKIQRWQELGCSVLAFIRQYAEQTPSIEPRTQSVE